MTTPNASGRDDGQLEETRSALRRLPRAASFLSWPLVALILIHTLFIGMWVAPSTPLRDIVTVDRVREYVQPWFQQNWSIFAPNPRRTAVTFEVRASVLHAETGEKEFTGWADLIDNEDAIVSGNLFPARTAQISRRTADRLHSALNDMNTEQRNLLKANYLETPVSELRGHLHDVAGGAGNSGISRYMAADAAATRIATGAAKSFWSDEGEIVYVQYRTSTRPAPSWNSDAEYTIDDTARTEREYGWRAAAELSGEQVSYFEPYLKQGGDWR